MLSYYPTVCHVMYCVVSCVGHKKCLAFVFFVMLFRVKCDDLPKNVVVMAGADKLLTCAEGEPFRWYRYLQSDPIDDKVLFMGTRMADNIDERFQVLKKPENFPYQRLDLLITDIQANHSGTYRCKQQQQSSFCAELIVLGSEPSCKIHVSKDTKTKDVVDLRCSIEVTINGQPEMVCMHQNGATLTDTPCSARENGLVTCLTKVPAEMKADYTCVIKIKHNPLRNYKMCNHASNEPDFQYTWKSSSGVSDDETQSATVWTPFGQLSVKELSFIIALCVSAVFNAVLLLVLYQRRHIKGSDSVETLTSDCESLTGEGQEAKERPSVNSEIRQCPRLTSSDISDQGVLSGKKTLCRQLLIYIKPLASKIC